MSKAAKIRELLDKGMTIKAIAKKLRVKDSYVHQVRWHAQKAAKKVAETSTHAVNLDFVKAPEPLTDTGISLATTSPSYYKSGDGEETWDYIVAHGINYLRGNIIKYVTRAGHKASEDELADLYKAQAYLDREIQRVKAGE
jgi:hypothetical protein